MCIIGKYIATVLIVVQYTAALAVQKTENTKGIDVDNDFLQEYAALRHMLIYDWGYTKEYADLVEINLKRAIREEIERQRRLGIEPPGKLRQENQLVSEEDDEEETTPAGPTTPGASPGDVVRGVAGILHSLGTLDVNNFWGSFVNFFPPIHREGAQALVDASQGRRPAKWPTLPTTTTKLTTTTDEADSVEEATVTPEPAATAVPVPAAATTVAAATGAPPTPTQSSLAVTEVATKAPTTKYTVRRRAATVLPGSGAVRNAENLLEDISVATSTQQTLSISTVL